MDFIEDTKKFSKLSVDYREAVCYGETKKAESLMKQIKDLVRFNAERLRVAFNVKMVQKKTAIGKGVGIPLIGNSVQKIHEKGFNLKRSDLTTLNTDSQKTLDGLNVLLDYSGSMWFDDFRSTINGIMRIHAQNFIALVLIEYMRMISKNRLKVIVNAFCRDSFIQQASKDSELDYDLLIVHNRWGSGGEMSKGLLPHKLKGVDNKFFTEEDLHGALNENLAVFKKQRIKNFITLFFTDGGLHRTGESPKDREVYVNTFIERLQSLCKHTTTLFSFIKEQVDHTALTCEKVGIKVIRMNDSSGINDCFQKFTHSMNQIRW